MGTVITRQPLARSASASARFARAEPGISTRPDPDGKMRPSDSAVDEPSGDKVTRTPAASSARRVAPPTAATPERPSEARL